MVTIADIVSKKEKLSLIGLGYVGLPIAVAFSKKVDVIGFDVNKQKIETYLSGKDPTREVGDEGVAKCGIRFTANAEELRKAKFHIVAVPTPINEYHSPDLTPVITASKTLGQNLTCGSVVVYESTVYPGVTEDICVPILEQASGLRCGEDFAIAYSPERINPGDRHHRLENIVKVVSGMDEQTLDTVARVYELIVTAGVYRAPCIQVAEAAKVIENCQRDINIAFMNELSIIFNRMGIDTLEVLKAAGTKWNFLNFQPGLVGGHCIGVDPYYLTYAAEKYGYHSQIILAGRHINDGMGRYVASQTVKMLTKSGMGTKNARVAILGFTFKENCPDTRNTRVIDIYNELREYGITAAVCDPIADAYETCEHYDIELIAYDELRNLDAVIIAVKHDAFVGMDVGAILSPTGVVLDIKGAIRPAAGHAYWRL